GPGDDAHRRMFFEPAAATRRGGARVDPGDPPAVLVPGKSGASPIGVGAIAPDGPAPPHGAPPAEPQGPQGTVPLPPPPQGTIVSVTVPEGAMMRAGEEVLVMEAMKMQHVIEARAGGCVRLIAVARGDTVLEGQALAFIEEMLIDEVAEDREEEIDLDALR